MASASFRHLISWFGFASTPKKCLPSAPLNLRPVLRNGNSSILLIATFGLGGASFVLSALRTLIAISGKAISHGDHVSPLESLNLVSHKQMVEGCTDDS